MAVCQQQLFIAEDGVPVYPSIELATALVNAVIAAIQGDEA